MKRPYQNPRLIRDCRQAMWAKRIIITIIALITVQVYPAAASDGECIELVNRDYTPNRYNINLDTGEIHEIVMIDDYSPGFYIPDTEHYYLDTSSDTPTITNQYTGESHTIPDLSHSVSWSPDKTRFTYVHHLEEDVEGEDSLLFYDAATATSTRIGDHIPSMKVLWAPNNNRFALSQRETSTLPYLQVYEIKNDVPEPLEANYEAIITDVDWSPDSMWLTYIDEVDYETEQLALVLHNMQTGEKLTYSYEASQQVSLFAWSPDSTHIALARKIDDEQTGITVLSVPDMDIVADMESTVSERVEIVWSPSSQRLLLSHDYFTDFDLIDLSADPTTSVSVRLGYDYPYYNWSADENYLLIYHTHGDLASTLTLLNRDGDVLSDGVTVPGSTRDFPQWHRWIDEHHFILRHWDLGFPALLVFDVRTGEYVTLSNPVGYYKLSPDASRILLRPMNMIRMNELPLQLRFYIWTGEAYTYVNPFNIPDGVRSLMWREDNSELIALFDDFRLQAYRIETDTWRDITTVPDSYDWSMRRIMCID